MVCASQSVEAVANVSAKQIFRPQRNRRCWSRAIGHLAMMCSACLLMLGCGTNKTNAQNAPTPAFAAPGKSAPFSAYTVSFAPSVTYAHALRMLTDIGVQPGYVCGVAASQSATSSEWPLWSPMGQRDQFMQSHKLAVEPGTLADATWMAYLRSNADVVGVTAANLRVCADMNIPVGAQPPAGPPAVYLTSEQVGVLRAVTFAPSTGYDTALYQISNLGLRLGDPCLEQALANGQQPAWRPVGQEATFAATHQLLVVSDFATSSLWQRQLTQQLDVLTVAAPQTLNC